jgi:hypothetical protein
MPVVVFDYCTNGMQTQVIKIPPLHLLSSSLRMFANCIFKGFFRLLSHLGDHGGSQKHEIKLAPLSVRVFVIRADHLICNITVIPEG